MNSKTIAFLIAVVFLTATENKSSAQISPKELIEKYVSETGGRKKYKEIENWNIKTRTLIIARIPRAKRKTKEDKEASMFQTEQELTMETSGRYLGKSKSRRTKYDIGCDGKIGWFKPERTGFELEQPNKDMGKIFLNLNMLLNPEGEFKSMKSLGVSKLHDELCHGIELVSKDGKVVKDYYSVETCLRYKTELTQTIRGEGERKIERYYRNYEKSKSGITMPMQMHEFHNGEGTIIMNILSFETNQKLDEKLFELPDEVKKLVKEKKQKSPFDN